MAFVERGEARIYWNSLGQGEPVVLVMGLGCSSACGSGWPLNWHAATA